MKSIDRPKVLIVDDQKANIVATEQVLQDLDIDILTALSGQEAIGQLLRHDNVALILLDVQMPDMDGFETATLIRRDPDTSSIPIIFVTAISKEDQYVFKGYEAGAVDYLFKPVDVDILISKVSVFVELYRERQKTQSALNRVEQLKEENDQLLNHAAEGILGLDGNGLITFANMAANRLLEANDKALIGLDIKKIVAPLSTEDTWQQSDFIGLFKTGGSRKEDDVMFHSLKDVMLPVSYTQAVYGKQRKMDRMVIIFQDISERKENQKQLETMAQYDQLTGLANRSLFWSYLNKTYANANRHSERFALLFIDLDKFKQVNDTLGHDAGDELLQKTSERLQVCVRESDLIARLGGDEFAIILSHVDSPEIAAHLADRMVKSLCEPFEIAGQEVNIGASIGVANYPDHGQDVTTLTKNADTAMYMAKEKGRNNFQFYRQEMQQQVEQHIRLNTALKQACESKEVIDQYHPVVGLDNLAICCYQLEVLWDNPVEGRSPIGYGLDPTLAYTIAPDLDRWQIDKALSAMDGWNLEKLDSHARLASPLITISLYSTAAQIERGIIFDIVEESLTAHQVDPQYLCLELSEDCLTSYTDAIAAQIVKLHEVGVNLNIRCEDTEKLSLYMLSKASLDGIKINSDVIQSIDTQEESKVLIQAYINMANAFELFTIVGGVDTESKLEVLKAMGCQSGYGSHIGPALSAEQIQRP